MTETNGFIPTNFTDEDFEAIERAGDLKLSSNLRAGIQQRVHNYERQVDYEASGKSKLLRKELVSQATKLRSISEFFRNLDQQWPGHLWSYIAAEAGVHDARFLKKLGAV